MPLAIFAVKSLNSRNGILKPKPKTKDQRPKTTMPDQPPRRLKTYTGSQGYVYQYYFVGSRPSTSD